MLRRAKIKRISCTNQTCMNEPLLFFPLYLADMPAIHGCPVNVDLTVHVLHINKARS